MVASRPLGPLDVAQQESPRADTSPAASVSTSPSSPARPLLPAERDINAAMDGFNAGVVDFLKGKEGVVSFTKSPTHFVFALGVVFFLFIFRVSCCLSSPASSLAHDGNMSHLDHSNGLSSRLVQSAFLVQSPIVHGMRNAT